MDRLHILTRPFGAALGDLLTQAKTYGGLGHGCHVDQRLVPLSDHDAGGCCTNQYQSKPLCPSYRVTIFNNLKQKSCSNNTQSLVLWLWCRPPSFWPAVSCSKRADQNNASAVSAAKATSKLGDLSAFHSIAVDVAAIVDKNDLPAAKARIKDLEVTWELAEAGLKQRAADDWHVFDKATDKSLAVLRADTPNQTDCKAAGRPAENLRHARRKVSVPHETIH